MLTCVDEKKQAGVRGPLSLSLSLSSRKNSRHPWKVLCAECPDAGGENVIQNFDECGETYATTTGCLNANKGK